MLEDYVETVSLFSTRSVGTRLTLNPPRTVLRNPAQLAISFSPTDWC